MTYYNGSGLGGGHICDCRECFYNQFQKDFVEFHELSTEYDEWPIDMKALWKLQHVDIDIIKMREYWENEGKNK